MLIIINEQEINITFKENNSYNEHYREYISNWLSYWFRKWTLKNRWIIIGNWTKIIKENYYQKLQEIANINNY